MRPGTQKAKGSRRERHVRDVLLDTGWAVTRAAGSMGLWDLVAIRRNVAPDEYLPFVRLVQVKSNRWPKRPEMDALWADASAYPAAWVSCEVWRIIDGKGGHQPIAPRIEVRRLNGPDVCELETIELPKRKAP